MKIAIDSGPLSSGHSIRGVGTYTRLLSESIGVRPVDITNANLSDYDVVHFTSFKPYELSIPFNKPSGTKFILTIYDLIPLIYPDHYPSGVKGFMNLLLNKVLINKNIDHVITISETSKKDICRFLGIDPKKITVTYLGPTLDVNYAKNENSPYQIKEKYSLPEAFALYVGDVNFNKNIPNLVKACKKASIKLVIVGKQAAEIEKMNLNHSELRHLKNVDWSNVKRVGFINGDDLIAIYKLAKVYIQPSFYEGFGLPVLDAFQAKTPVVAAKNQALVEIAEGCALFADPKDYLDIALKIRMFLDSKAPPSLIKNATNRLSRFTWKNTARETLDVYNL